MIEPTDEMLDAHEQARRAYWDALDADTGEGGMTVAEHERVARRQAMAAALKVLQQHYSVTKLYCAEVKPDEWDVVCELYRGHGGGHTATVERAVDW